VKKAAVVAAAIGGCLAVVEGLLLIVLGGLAGLAKNQDGETAMADGYVVLALGIIVPAAPFFAPRSPLVLAVTTAVSVVLGFVAENALRVFAAAMLFAAAALAIVPTLGELRSSSRSRP
jgi:hypothetical protein